MTLAGRDVAEIDALVTDRYLDALLASGEVPRVGPAADVPGSGRGRASGAPLVLLGHSNGGLVALLGLAGLTALLSNLVSNVPAVILLHPLVTELGGGERLWQLLALASTFAGNLTLVGSAANLIVAEKAHAEGIRIGFWEYLRVGLPLSLLAGVLGTLWLAWV